MQSRARRYTARIIGVVALVATSTEATTGSRDSTWYRTQSAAVSLVEQKATMPVDARHALKIFDDSENRIAADWREHLPMQLSPADHVGQMPEHRGVLRANEPGPLKIEILGFDTDTVHIVLARRLGQYISHQYHAVEADLMINRSPDIDQLLDLVSFTEPFLRMVRGVGYGMSREQVHDALGPPNAHRGGQGILHSWDYYFDAGITIEYHSVVHKIVDHVPESIRNRTTKHPLVRYLGEEKAAERERPSN